MLLKSIPISKNQCIFSTNINKVEEISHGVIQKRCHLMLIARNAHYGVCKAVQPQDLNYKYRPLEQN